MKRLSFFVLLPVTFFSCNGKKVKDPNDFVVDPKKIEVGIDPHKDSSCYEIRLYCWCFDFKTSKYKGSPKTPPYNCETVIAIPPDALVDQNNLSLVISDSSQVRAIVNLVNRKSGTEKTTGVDSRFLLLFKKRNVTDDTFVTGNTKQYYYNGYNNTYTFNIMDSILGILKKDSIDCPVQ